MKRKLYRQSPTENARVMRGWARSHLAILSNARRTHSRVSLRGVESRVDELREMRAYLCAAPAPAVAGGARA